MGIFEQLPELLLPWYHANKRDLPWRKDKDPYHIWVSEIMLQQTRVEAVRGYYERFLAALPDVAALANAGDELLYKLWEGLGYYSRVRNLKKAAIVIMDEYNGVFPQQYEQVLGLPGIGAYTAGAICSIAFNQRTPAVDGNVLRVVSRLTNDATPIDTDAYKKKVNINLVEIYPAAAGEFTQALMELGATVCGPNRKPDCDHCPCNKFCQGFRCGTADSLPIKSAKKPRRIEDHTVLILRCGEYYALEQRPKDGLLAGLWQFPNVPGKLELADALHYVEQKELKPKGILYQVERKHIFTHVEWHMRGVYIIVGNKISQYEWMTADQIDCTAALPTAFRMFWDEAKHIG